MNRIVAINFRALTNIPPAKEHVITSRLIFIIATPCSGTHEEQSGHAS